MSSKKYQVGAEIEAWCTKCKLNRQHAIETLKSDGNINRVICKTCDGSHLFRRPKGPDGKTKRASSGTGKRRTKGAVVLSDEELARAKPYAQSGIFQAGDLIRHTKFGPGRVLRVRPGRKMEVGFEDGPKLLVYARKSS